MSSIGRSLSGDVLLFHLSGEREHVNDRLLLERHGRNARTLLKEGPLRVTLVMVRAGGHIGTHHSDGPFTVQVLDGDILFRWSEEEYRLAAGDLLVAGAGLEHDVASTGGGTFLLTISHPGSAQPARDGPTDPPAR